MLWGEFQVRYINNLLISQTLGHNQSLQLSGLANSADGKLKFFNIFGVGWACNNNIVAVLLKGKSRFLRWSACRRLYSSMGWNLFREDASRD